MPPFMGLTSWASFMSGKAAEAMVMGDMVLFQDEVNPAMSVALDNGLAVTALHNQDRKSTRLNSSHTVISYAVFCLKKKNKKADQHAETKTHINHWHPTKHL